MSIDVHPHITWQVTEVGHTYCNLKIMESVSEIWQYCIPVDMDLSLWTENNKVKDNWNTK